MPDNIHDTKVMLERHHRDGDRFAQMMLETANGRFNDEFWQCWQQWIEPVLGKSGLVLDLGSGPGAFIHLLANRMPGIRIMGVECMDYMIEAAGELPPGCEIIAADLHDPQLPVSTGSVDAALAAVVLHEMNQPVRALRELQRCVRPGGRIVVLDWVRVPLEQYLAGENADPFVQEKSAAEIEDIFVHFVEHNRFSAGDLRFMLQKTGFKVLEVGSRTLSRMVCPFGTVPRLK